MNFYSFLLQVNLSSDTSSVAEPTEQTLSLLELIAGGGWYIMLPLGILSVAAVYIFIERFLKIQNVEKEDPNFMNQMKDFIYDGKIDAAKALCQTTQRPFSRMIEKG